MQVFVILSVCGQPVATSTLAAVRRVIAHPVASAASDIVSPLRKRHTDPGSAQEDDCDSMLLDCTMNVEHDPIVETRDEMGEPGTGRRSQPLHLLAESPPWRWVATSVLVAAMLAAFSPMAVRGLAHNDTGSFTEPDRGRARSPRGRRCAEMLPVAPSPQNAPGSRVAEGTHAFPPVRYPGKLQLALRNKAPSA